MNKSTTKSTEVGAVVLCGGKSQRMGFDKSQLPIGTVSLLDHIISELSHSCTPIVVSVASELAGLPTTGKAAKVYQVVDQNPDAGPLEGIRASLEFLETKCKYAFITACDVPHVNSAVVECLRQNIGDSEAIIPFQGSRLYGMTSLLKTSAHGQISELIRAKRLRVSYLADILQCVRLPVASLQPVDPDLLSLTNINTPDEYFQFLEDQGLECDEATRHKLSGGAF